MSKWEDDLGWKKNLPAAQCSTSSCQVNRLACPNPITPSGCDPGRAVPGERRWWVTPSFWSDDQGDGLRDAKGCYPALNQAGY